MSLRTEFGHAVRRMRLAAGMSQEELARRARISRVTMTTIETDSPDVKLDTVEKLAKALKVQPWEILREAAR